MFVFFSLSGTTRVRSHRPRARGRARPTVALTRAAFSVPDAHVGATHAPATGLIRYVCGCRNKYSLPHHEGVPAMPAPEADDPVGRLEATTTGVTAYLYACAIASLKFAASLLHITISPLLVTIYICHFRNKRYSFSSRGPVHSS